MEMVIEKGTVSDIDELEQLYNNLIDHLTNTVNYPGWVKGIYPVRDTAAEGVKDEALFVIRDSGKIAGTIILRHKQEPAYLSADWHVKLADSEILVVYTFAVHPMYLKKGIGKKLLDFAEEYGRNAGVKAIRLDVYEKNAPAINLYKKCGYQYIERADLGYGAYGLDWYGLFQKIL